MPMPVMRRDTRSMRITLTGMIITIMATMTMIITATTISIMIMPRTIMAMGTITTTTSIVTIPTITTAMLMTTNEPIDAGRLAGHEAAALYRLMTWLSPAFPV